jgi:dolichol-phosphate mannosyltransferase
MPTVGVILPTYNEAVNLRGIVAEILRHLPDAQIWVVDDASPDGTGTIAEDLARERPGSVVAVQRPSKDGLGNAYRDAFRRLLETDLQTFAQMDADFSHPPEVLPRLVAALEDVDLALGSRYVPGGGTKNWDWKRRLLSRGGNWYARTVLGSPARDLTGGFKAYRRKVLEHVATLPLPSSGYSFQIEFTASCLAAGFSWTEIPFTFVERREGVSKMSGGIVREAVGSVLRLRRRLRDQRTTR